MLPNVWNRKVARLPSEGVLLICTDLQGNLRDFEQMVALYREERANGPVVLAFCGDLVHGPSPELQRPGAWPRHLGTQYVDESAELLLQFEQLVAEEAVMSVMGNHEHAHVGGPVVPKFYPDEAAILNDALGDHRERICDLLRALPLVAVSESGVVLTHGSPRQAPERSEDLETLSWEGYEHVPLYEMAHYDVLGSLLWARGCTDHQARAFLAAMIGRPSGVVVHGHDVVRAGFARQGAHHMVVSTSFALSDENKTYVRVDLGARYDTTADLREGVELRHLYGARPELPQSQETHAAGEMDCTTGR